jgi:uncharacterized phage protein (TIGR02218 family)
MPHSQTPAITALSIGNKFCFARCWHIVRLDGTAYRLTDHDQPLTLADGTYTPIDGVDASAAQHAEGTRPDNVSVSSVISSSTITQADLEAGLFRGASVVERVVDHRYPYAGTFAVRTYYFTSLTYNTELGVWNAECSGLMSKFEKNRGHRYSKVCRWDLFSTQCGVNKASFSASLSVTSSSLRNAFVATPSAHDAAGFFEDGYVEWTTGANAGTKQVIKAYNPVTKVWILQTAAPYAISASDSATVSAGCNKLSGVNQDGSADENGHCKFRFSNLVRFGGFPFMPFNDKLFATPDAAGSQ